MRTLQPWNAPSLPEVLTTLSMWPYKGMCTNTHQANPTTLHVHNKKNVTTSRVVVTCSHVGRTHCLPNAQTLSTCDCIAQRLGLLITTVLNSHKSYTNSIGTVVHPITVTLPVNEAYQTCALKGGMLTTLLMRPYHTMRTTTQNSCYPHMYNKRVFTPRGQNILPNAQALSNPCRETLKAHMWYGHFTHRHASLYLHCGTLYYHPPCSDILCVAWNASRWADKTAYRPSYQDQLKLTTLLAHNKKVRIHKGFGTVKSGLS